MQQVLCKSKNGVSVTFDPENSHAATHFNDAPNLKALVVELVQGLDLKGQEIAQHFDLGRTVGVMDVVKVDEDDELLYAMRKNRKGDGLVPFVKSRTGTPCPYVAIHLVPQQDGTYELSSAWIGTFGGDDEPFPMASDATQRSVEFWKKHAFVWGSQEVYNDSVTDKYPW